MVKQEVLKMIDDVKVKETCVFDMTVAIEKLKKMLSVQEAEIMTAITKEIDPTTNKPKYSNEQSRKAAFEIIAGTDATLQKLVSHIETGERELELLKIDVRHLLRTVEALEVFHDESEKGV